MATRLERYRGALLGLATGDALGTTLEFMPPGSFEPLTDMVGGGPFGLEPGQWTDDTSMALCLAESLVERQGFNAHDQMLRYVRWYREGYWSSTGECFDIGGATMTALEKFDKTGDAYAGSRDPERAGNGSLMRLAAVPLAYAKNPVLALLRAAESSETTHGARTCIDACRYAAGIIVGLVDGVDKEEVLKPYYAPVADVWERQPLTPEIDAVAAGSFRDKEPPEIRGTGYVVDSFEAALWAFASTGTFADGVLKAVNLGDDADTTGAVYGQIAGAYYGVAEIPQRWRVKVARGRAIDQMARKLFDLAERKPLE